MKCQNKLLISSVVHGLKTPLNYWHDILYYIILIVNIL